MVHGIGSAATRSISINRDTEDVSRCSLSKIYIYVCACSFVIIERSCLYRAYFRIHFFLRKERRGEQDSSIFFFIIEIQRLLKFDFLNISLFFQILLLFLREISID